MSEVNTGAVELDPSVRARLRNAVRARGVCAVASELGLNRATVTSALSLRVRRSTAAVIAAGLKETT